MWAAEMGAKEIRRHRNLIIGMLLVATLIVLVYPYVEPYQYLFYNAEELRDFIQGFGVLAPLVLIALQVLQVLVAPIPGQVLGIAAGYSFGVFWGTFFAMIGAGLGSFVAIFLAKRYGRPAAEYFVKEESMDRFDDLTAEYGFMPFFLLFLLPGFPDDTVCFIAGLTKLDMKRLVVYATIGRFPGMLALTLTGDSLALSKTKMFIILAVVVFIVSGVSVLERQRILDYSKHRREKKNGE